MISYLKACSMKTPNKAFRHRDILDPKFKTHVPEDTRRQIDQLKMRIRNTILNTIDSENQYKNDDTGLISFLCFNKARNRIHDLKIDIEYVFKYTIESNLNIRNVNDPNITRMHHFNDKSNKTLKIDRNGGAYLSSKTICCPVSNNIFDSKVFARPTKDAEGLGNSGGPGLNQFLFTCVVCDNAQKIPCSHCQEGKLVCPKCGGEKQDILREDIGIQGDWEIAQQMNNGDNPDGEIMVGAQDYGGDGQLVTCDMCMGIGEIDCTTCEGSRFMNCPNCSSNMGHGSGRAKGTSKVTAKLKNALFVKTDVFVSPIELPMKTFIQGKDSKCVQQIWRYQSNVEDDDETDESIFHMRSKYFKKVVRDKIWTNICSKHRRYGRRHDLYKECTYLDVFPVFIVRYVYQGLAQTHVVIA